ncbi:RDD family protein [Leptospira langatensis]|uniref:RDD family protein n=1 Tax=Leptospira langatensis TaxID=2484983 RepID=A0A5F1ZRB5_9LEPT|nr:RDD family protein [Leptospira langatensis]TGK02768.1 RDD family protein [Leptospira langatensis]TGL40027.1 RDD family protein [Leptospira langatensis]
MSFFKEVVLQKGSVRHAGLGIRIYAQLLDFLVLCPVFIPYGFVIYYHDKTVYQLLPFYTALHSLLYVGYRFILHAKFGRTLGKNWAGILVVDCDYQDLGWVKSFLRCLPELLLSAVTITKASFDSMIFMQHSAEMTGLTWAGVNRILQKANPLEDFAVWDSVVYYGLSALLILFSHQKRALHDMVSGARVVWFESQSNDKSRS